jgi:hypothetical protein
MELHGISLIEQDYEPEFGTAFLLNIFYNEWKYYLMVFECSHPDDSNVWFGYYGLQLNKHRYPEKAINLNGLFYVDHHTNIAPEVVLKKLRFKNKKLYTITLEEINSFGIFGVPFTVEFNPTGIPKTTKRLWFKVTSESISNLKKNIPANKHVYFGLIQ